MKAIGIIKSVNLNALKKYVLDRKKHDDKFEQEKINVFQRMYEEKVFPKTLPVLYEYGSGTYNAGYGDQKHKGKCKDIFCDFFKMWRTDRSCSYDPDYENRESLKIFDTLREHLNYAEKYNQPLYYIYESDFGYYIEDASFKVFIPKEFVKAEAFIDYSDTPLHLIGGNEDLSKNLPSVGDETQNSLKSKLEEQKAEIEKKVEEINRKKEEQKEEIEAMKRAIENKYQSAFALMEEKKEELELMMQQLEGQLFVLDTQIYGIRCFFGETVRFTKLTSGKEAPLDAPVVMYQKIRFLDEELAKYAALYDVDGDDTKLFEDLLIHRQDMRDLFFPAGKSLSLVRISRDGLSYKIEQHASASTGTINIYSVMKSYEKYHGTQIAILVRNGENCYIGWTETDRIAISDGNAFLTPKDVSVDDEAELKKDIYGNVIEEKTAKEEVAARFFIFSIAQGLIENSKLLPLPEGVNVTQSSHYVVFSMADNWITDNTYGDYEDIMDACSVNIRKGDRILTCRSLSAEGDKYRTYNNDRGRGYANRTHDVYASDNSIYPVNLVEDDDSYNQLSYQYKRKTDKEWVHQVYNGDFTEEDCMEEFLKHHDTVNYEYQNFLFLGPKKHVFISLLKQDCSYWNDSNSRANFELYSDEYINLTFLNTVYMRYIIVNRKMPRSFGGSRVNFSYILPYLNHALEFLKEREQKEEQLITAYTQLSENWQVELSEWKIHNNVHEITEYQAKRFAKWYSK